MATGFHSITFNAENLSSGIYIYRIEATPCGGQAGKFVQVKKMKRE
jgi:hypothetical protein